MISSPPDEDVADVLGFTEGRLKIDTEETRDVVRVETVIVGAGPSGLSVAACLRRAGVPFVILERDERVGAAWHRHYERLRLHTDKARSGLPYFPFPKHYPKYVLREQLTAYLESYARHFELRPRFGQEVFSAYLHDGWWHTQTQDTVYVSRHLVVATGYNTLPHVPTWPGQETFTGEVVHSSDYRNGAHYREKRVLVVGFGNSGGDIALDLWEHGAEPELAIRSSVNLILPRDLLGITALAINDLLAKLPIRLASALIAAMMRLIYGDLVRLNLPEHPYGPFATDYSWPLIAQIAVRKPPYGPFAQIEAWRRQQRPRHPLIDTGIIDAVRNGHVGVRPDIDRFGGQDVVFMDGTRQRYETVILATGYRPVVNFLEQAFQPADEHGEPRWNAGEAAALGLYFCGFYLATAGMLREIAAEAKKIAGNIAQKQSLTSRMNKRVRATR